MTEHYGSIFAVKNRYYNEDIFRKFFKVSYLEEPTNYECLEKGWENKYILSCKPDIKKYVDFQQSDIFDDKDLISKENTILLFRNVWRYLGDDGIDKLSDFLAKNMKKSSILVIGEFDRANHIDTILTNKGFKDTLYYRGEHHIFEPPGEL
jgi:chemotaxis methyl-accepting protein methylase